MTTARSSDRATSATTDELLRRALEGIPTSRRLPESTYRLQFHAGFTFRDATAIIPYLHNLGITHVYASPYLKARPGSMHGYDVIDHSQLNPELGTEADYDAFTAALRQHDMGHILDMVPNHVGVGTNDNAWWNDVLENGVQSRYRYHFDIAWRGSPRAELHDKVLLPVLGKPYGNALEDGELRLVFENQKIKVAYYDRRFPIARLTFQQNSGGAGSAPPAAEQIEAFNGTPGDAPSFDRLDQLLNAQSYRLCYWRVASDEINYRRFFDINDLAALGVERQEVFDDSHALVFRLITEGKIDGLRIDHPDGLYDPKQYFDRLQRRFIEARTGARLPEDEDCSRIVKARPLYVVAEKILAVDEALPPDWACHGTSGYDFLNMVNGLFVDGASEQALTQLYSDQIADDTPFEELVYRKKKLILEISLASELQMLAHRLDWIAQRSRHTRDFTHNGLRHALREIIACFPVYRSYITEQGVQETDRQHVETAVRGAISRNPRTDPSVFHFVRDAVLQKYPPGFDQEARDAQLQFAGKFQQLTAPTTAKGIEDTAFYIYNRLISLNEVGGDPAKFGVPADELHRYLADRQAHWPYAMSSLSTHDTKRSEDVRARINVLSEMPEEWRERVQAWSCMNAQHRQQGCRAPDANEEYLLYQTLVGVWPSSSADAAKDKVVERVQAYLQKAMREAKVNTSWTDVNGDHEKAVEQFIAEFLNEQTNAKFFQDFLPFQQRVSWLGMINSLSQTLLRIAAPGVPDTYQGTELWDLSLVDPDNRRPVDYDRRISLLRGLDERTNKNGAAATAADVLANPIDGRIKLFVTSRALRARREHPGLFSAGEYIPIKVSGACAINVFAFARMTESHAALVVVPRLCADLGVQDGQLPIGEIWKDTSLQLPPALRLRQWRSALVGAETRTEDTLRLSDFLSSFPVGLLISQS